MLGLGHLTVPLHIATVVVPVAVYFLILGLLNTRRRPQLLTGRRDFALLVVALAPIFVLPALNYVGVSLVSVSLALGAVVAVIRVLAPPRGTWVIYNIPLAEARAAVESALAGMDLEIVPIERGWQIENPRAKVELGGFSLLQNVSVRIRGGDEQLTRRFERRLSGAISCVQCEPRPVAVMMLLVATGMLVAPLAMVGREAGEIVRILTDLLK